MQNSTANLDKITGVVEKIVFRDPENGYSVLNISIDNNRDSVAIVGHIAFVAIGEHIEAEGSWIYNKRYGKQFKAEILKTLAPNSLIGIEKYLSSGLIKGIGSFYAKKLVNAFGVDILDIIEKEPHRLKAVEGIGMARVDKIVKSWSQQKIIRELMLFLYSYDIPTSRAVKIFKTYGPKSIEVIRENPYLLAQDISGIGFKTADNIAMKTGIEKESPLRIKAGIHYCLTQSLEQAQCSLPLWRMLEMCLELLDVSQELIRLALQDCLARGVVAIEEINGVDCLFLKHVVRIEQFIAERLLQIRDAKLPWANIDSVDSIEYVEEALNINLSATQKNAIEEALKTKLLIITGGPGVGKTTIINSILKILLAENVKVSLAAPTGRAAKKMSEATGHEAKTLHRLLQKNFGQDAYSNNIELDCDLLIVDEMSMVDISLMYSLLKALPTKAALFLVGDIDQLPSVGPGTVLNDMVFSNAIPVMRLTEIFRQAQTSSIITNAYKVNQGILPTLHGDNDFIFIESATQEDTLRLVIELAVKKLPESFNISIMKDIQILCPMNKGLVGTRNLNLAIQKKLNPSSITSVNIFGSTFRVGDKVMQMTNNYDKDVYNGDIGVIKEIFHEDKEVLITFDNRNVVYEFDDLDEISLAYAITIHKSQGSEYHAVIIPILTEHFVMLQRNLLYTAITRGKKQVIIVGQARAVEMAVAQQNSTNRYSGLQKRLELLHKNISVRL